MTYEGSPSAQFYDMIYGDKTLPNTITRAVVTAVSPEIAIRIDGDNGDIFQNEFIVAEHLLEHKRLVTMGGGEVEMIVRSPLNVGDPLIIALVNDGQLVYVLDKAVV